DVEELVTNPLEDALLGVDNVKEITSTSGTGFSSIGIEFEIGTDIDDVRVDVEGALDRGRAEFPSDAEDTELSEVSFDDTPIKVFSLSGNYPVEQLTIFAKDLKDALSRIQGVTDIAISGGREREIRVLVDRAKLDSFGLSLTQVTNAISRANATIPVGNIQSNDQQYSVRFDGQLQSVEEIAKTAITAGLGSPILVSDVAEVIDGYESVTSISQFTSNAGTAPAITLSVFKKGDGNILRIVSEVDDVIASASGTVLPSDISVEVIDDTAEFIREDLTNLSVSGLQTTLIVILLILFMLGPRESVLAGISIPLTFLITFIFLGAFGFTINFLSLFSLVLALGILVDAAIVITEGIYENIQKGLPASEASAAAIKEFQYPLTAGTLTTVFAFLPMLTVSGIIGEFIKSIPVTISIVLFASLFVALGVIPAFAAAFFAVKENADKTPGLFARMLRPVTQRVANVYDRLTRARDRFVTRVQESYRERLVNHLVSKGKKRALIGGLVIALIFSLFLPIGGMLKVDMFPATDMERIYVDISYPIGTPIEVTAERLPLLEAYFSERSEIASFATTAGGGSSLTGGTGSHIVSATINLREEKRPDSRDLIEIYDRDLTPLASPGSLTVQQLGSGPDAMAPVAINIVGDDLVTLEAIASQFERLLTSIPGTRIVSSSVEETAGEFVVRANRSVLGNYGITASDIAFELRSSVYGVTAMTLREDGEDIDVNVKYQLSDSEDADLRNETTANQLMNLTMVTPKGDVPLSTFATIDLEASRNTIRHTDGDRIVTVSSGLQKGFVVSDILDVVTEEMADMQIPDGYNVSFGGQSEDMQSFIDLLIAMVFGMVLIMILLVLQFSSYRQPLIVVSSVPLALIGVFPGLALIGQPLSFPGMIGVVALSGIVVNNGIILIDRFNQLRKEGIETQPAVIDAAVSRLRPILLTTITTVAGLLPLVISQPSWAPLGFAIIFGLLFSTILTLFVVPILSDRYAEPLT
ncbi:MAG: efflux RND transporter permease subunit, partial [bacterium]|nr:efflux RND transporter permease subunit [bacterium]